MSFLFFSKSHSHLDASASHVFLSEKASLYLTNTLRQVAVSLIGIFLPIYIYELSQDYHFFSTNPVTNGLLWNLSYFLLRSASSLAVLFLCTRFIFTKLHFQLSITISYIALVFELFLWILAKGNIFLILLAGTVAGIKVIFYWIPFHIYFIRKSAENESKIGAVTSNRFFLTQLFSGATPAIGGLIIATYGFDALFLTTILVLIMSSLPIIFAVHEWRHRDHNVLSILKNYTFNRRTSITTFSYIGEGFEALIYAVFWPLLLYFVLNNFVKIGVLNSLSFILSALGFLVVGKIIDKYGSRYVHLAGVFFNSIFYALRVFLSLPFGLYILDLLDRINSGMYLLPQMAASYKRAKKLDASEYNIHREISIHFGIIFLAVILMILLEVVHVWRWVFVFAIIGSLLTYLIEVDN